MIPLSVPHLAGNEWKYIKECLDTNWVSSVGEFVNRFEKNTAEFTGAKHAVATSNGTSALHISLMLSGVGRDDYVIAPNITFIASINSIAYTGASPILIDVDRHTWQMDLDLLETFLAGQTYIKEGKCFLVSDNRCVKAIMPVHVLGNMCDMNRLMKIADQYRLSVVEDATEALGSFYNNRHAGTFGKFGTLSYNGNKIITTGGGGVILTNDEALGKKAKHITTQAKADEFEYYHDEVGYNYRLVNILAAMGVAQMEQLPGFLERKKAITQRYNKRIQAIEGVSIMQVIPGVRPNNWLYTVIVPQMRELMKYLLENKVQVRPLWVPMNQLPMYTSSLYVQKENVSSYLYENCISLPCSSGISDSDVDKVCALIEEFYRR